MIIQFDQYSARKEIKRIALQRDIGGAIAKAYPHINWYINVSEDCSLLTIQIPDISQKFGYQMAIRDIKEVLMRKAKMAAGEVLERFNLSRDALKDNFVLAGIRPGTEHFRAAQGGF
jgi:hypothetical protein